VIPKALHLLAELGVSLTVPQARVDHGRARLPEGEVNVSVDDLCRVVRRREFDALLAWTARDRGVTLRQREHVLHVAREDGGVRLETERASYWAPVDVGADGSGSLVRRALVGERSGPIARAVMCDVPIEASRWEGHAARRYDFDFAACAAGLRGYRWVFPCIIDGVPHANVGVYALPPVDGVHLQAELRQTLAGVGAEPRAWKAFPIRTYASGAAVAAPHALLVGDAAGADPPMGGGIAFALEYGVLAADAILAARATGDWSFRSYARAVARGAIGRK